ncbi:hypothetical protein BC629DRAFT_202171 [Irpex lacteus]|nr:hypothetical protein BC629DRAFT_202171 [Irpex lacteus]
MDRAERAREDSTNLRPAKRPRLLPDGFAPPITHNHKRTVHVPTPVFHSDFATTTTASTTATRRGEGSRGVVVRPQFGGGLPKASNKDGSNDTDTANSKSKPLAKRPPPSFSLSGTGKPQVKGGTDASLVRASALSLAFASPAKGKEREKERERGERESNTSRMLHNPPTTSTTTRKPSNVPLKPVPIPPPLPLPRPHTSSQSKMKTISTTRVALATDPRTESGSSELFSLFLRHQGGGGGGKGGVGVYGDAVDRELGRGLEVSPEKGRREGRGRFVRGGLAESFSRRFAESDTDQKLWEEYTARSYNYKHAAGKVKVKVKADVKLKTISLLHRTPLPQNTIHTQHKSRAPVVTLARCLVLDSVPPSHSLSHSHSHTNEGEFGKGKEVTVLFRHNLNHSALGTGMGKSASVDMQLGEGIEVHVWRPWLELSAAASPDVGVGVGASGPVWLCSRFHVVPLGDGARAS